MLSQIREQGIQKPVNRAEEAAAALSVLGYSSTEISSALKDIDVANLTLEQIIRSALKNMLRT
jgi:Holliday junction DNA helicase RuvA